MKIKTDGIILDIDGTIWDSTGIVAVAWNKAAASAGVKLKEPVSAGILKTQFGKPMDEIADNVFPDETPEKRKDILELCCRYEHEALMNDPCDVVFPGVRETIRELSGKIPFFIVSNCQSGYIELVCEKTGLTEFITDNECFGNTGFGKADNLRSLIQRNGLVSPVYVGDTEGDRTACVQAGVPFIFASYGFGQAEGEGVAAEIDRFDRLKDILELP